MMTSVLIVSLLSITILAVIGYPDRETGFKEEPPPWGEKDIIRIYETENEMQAIEAAEHLPLTSIFNRTRFKNSERTNDTAIVIRPFGIVWFNLIDNITIDAFSKRFDIINENDSHPISLFKYHAECVTRTDIEIVYDNQSLTIDIMGEITESVGSISYFRTDEEEIVIPWNELIANYKPFPPSFSILLDKCFIIDQSMGYTEETEPHEHFGGSIKQLIVMDGDLEPVLININGPFSWLT